MGRVRGGAQLGNQRYGLNAGLFMWRGTTLPAEITEHVSFEYHKFQKLEFKDANTRKLVTEHWLNLTPDTKVEGLAAQCVKYYK